MLLLVAVSTRLPACLPNMVVGVGCGPNACRQCRQPSEVTWSAPPLHRRSSLAACPFPLPASSAVPAQMHLPPLVPSTTQSVNQPLNQSPTACSVQYATGEVELLDLDEVIRDGHCSLLA